MLGVLGARFPVDSSSALELADCDWLLEESGSISADLSLLRRAGLESNNLSRETL